MHLGRMCYIMYVISDKGQQAFKTILNNEFKYSSGLENDRFILMYV